MTGRGTRIAAAALLVVAALGSTALGAAAADSLDTGPIRRSIRKDLAGAGIPVKVTCPTVDADAKKLSCTAVIDGQTVHVKVKTSGSSFTWKRVEAVLLIEKMEGLIERNYSQKVAAGAVTKADCGLPADQVVLVAKVGSTFPCTVAVEDGTAETLTVLVKNVAGAFEVERA
jgi:hypothetical protein